MAEPVGLRVSSLSRRLGVPSARRNRGGANSGVAGGINFAGFENLEGLGGNDTFTLAAGGSVASIDGGADNDTLNGGVDADMHNGGGDHGRALAAQKAVDDSGLDLNAVDRYRGQPVAFLEVDANIVEDNGETEIDAAEVDRGPTVHLAPEYEDIEEPRQPIVELDVHAGGDIRDLEALCGTDIEPR